MGLQAESNPMQSTSIANAPPVYQQPVSSFVIQDAPVIVGQANQGCCTQNNNSGTLFFGGCNCCCNGRVGCYIVAGVLIWTAFLAGIREMGNDFFPIPLSELVHIIVMIVYIVAVAKSNTKLMKAGIYICWIETGLRTLLILIGSACMYTSDGTGWLSKVVSVIQILSTHSLVSDDVDLKGYNG